MDDYYSIAASHVERRRHTRTPVGVPVRVHFSGHALPVAVKLRDVSFGGCYFTGGVAPPAAKFAFGFVLPDRQICVAGGRVLRVDRDGFAATLSRSSESFNEFMGRLSGPVTTRTA